MAEYDPSGLPDMSEQQPANEYSDKPEAQAAGDEDEDDDYDPSSFNFGESNNEESTTQPTQVDTRPAPADTKPKTLGGFIVEDDDDEEEGDEDTNAAPPPSQLNGTEGAQSGFGAAAVSEAMKEDVPLASEPTQDSAAAQQASLNGSASSTTVPPLPTDLDTASSSIAVPLPSAQASAVVDQGKQTAFSPAAAGTIGTASVSATPTRAVNGVTAPPDSAVPPTPTTQRLPHDKVGRLEDRIKEDPKADPEAWWELIQHYRDKDQLDNARKVFERMLEIWPTSPKIYLTYLALEYPLFDRNRIDALFNQSLTQTPSLQLWTQYLSYLRRVFPLIPDQTGDNRRIITQGFDAVLSAVGNDPDSGQLWQDYIDFLKSGPGDVTKTGWQDLQKVDQVRKGYQLAIKVPMGETVRLWKEYDHFEMSVNKATARKILNEQSPHYMTARTAARQIENITEGLIRGEDALATLPPLEGCEGDDAFAAQVAKWRAWIEWEKIDPLVLKDDGNYELYRKRIQYAYKQATIALRFWPTIWYEAAAFCFEEAAASAAAATASTGAGQSEKLVQEGEEFLDEGLKANPESVLLTLKKADRVEEGLQTGTVSDDVAVGNGEKMEVVFEPALKALYELHKKTKERGVKAEREVREYFAALPTEENGEDGDDAGVREEEEEGEEKGAGAGDSPVEKPKKRAELEAERIKAVQSATKETLETLKRTISYIWIAKMRAFRRIQGQGAPGKAKKGFRGVFAEARPRGQLSADVYVASALMEWHCYKDASALKIFERGLKLFPTDEGFAVEYIKHLISVNDLTNARVVFETTVTKILGASTMFPEEQRRREKVRGLLEFMHGFESQFGDLSAVRKLEGRMRELFPSEFPAQELRVFAGRYEMGGFDGMGVQLILSPTQVRPKTTFLAPPPMQGVIPIMATPGGLEDARLQLGPNGPYVASPKRPLEDDGTDNEGTPRKYLRAESPLKGAAGRRVQGHNSTNSTSLPAGGNTNMLGGTLTTVVGNSSGGSGFMTKNYVPPTSPAFQAGPAGGGGAPGAAGAAQPPIAMPSLPREIMYLLTILPNASKYHSVSFDPGRVLDLIGRMNLEAHRGRITGGGGGYGMPR